MTLFLNRVVKTQSVDLSVRKAYNELLQNIIRSRNMTADTLEKIVQGFNKDGDLTLADLFLNLFDHQTTPKSDSESLMSKLLENNFEGCERIKFSSLKYFFIRFYPPAEGYKSSSSHCR